MIQKIPMHILHKITSHIHNVNTIYKKPIVSFEITIISHSKTELDLHNDDTVKKCIPPYKLQNTIFIYKDGKDWITTVKYDGLYSLMYYSRLYEDLIPLKSIQYGIPESECIQIDKKVCIRDAINNVLAKHLAVSMNELLKEIVLERKREIDPSIHPQELYEYFYNGPNGTLSDISHHVNIDMNIYKNSVDKNEKCLLGKRISMSESIQDNIIGSMVFDSMNDNIKTVKQLVHKNNKTYRRIMSHLNYVGL